jgi:hypothetical protein
MKVPGKYWPNDPGYPYKASPKYSERESGAWNFFSFIPERSPGAAPIRPQETASGMSVDMAWRITIGEPNVRIAVCDSGIKWDERDLIEKAYLNAGELKNHKPHKAGGAACGGTGELAGFDCNEDGVLSVSDYKDEPSLKPEASGDHPKGDKNNNKVLDAGDLILNYSDKVDDDGNGYVDDISGWDFMKDDNDPYDDTRYGHGTGEANDSCAATNNGMADAGVCPLCRFIPLRVGDSFIADVNDYAQAVIYAADNGASVVQEALGTIDMSAFAQAAEDYAYKKGVTIVASMADENARHHNMPATSNHTLPVHAIVMVGSEEATSATSFLGYHPCSNYGGQNLLSAPGTGCSSNATGVLSGVMGLVYSAAVKYKVTPALTAGEGHQLALMTADDIYVSESADPASGHYFSQPGFDQRFGYGRVNANTAVEWVRAGKIPPEIDIVSPTWFTVLYKDKVNAPVEIAGTVAAKRANGYDLYVEWAPGVEPLDSDFKVISDATRMNVAPTVVLGQTAPLAQLEIRGLNVSHPRDRDSPHGENDTAITVRARAVAHYGGAIGDVPAQMRRTYYVHEDPDLLPGFPLYVGSSGEASPKLADLDGDGVRDIVSAASDGAVHVYKITAKGPVDLPGFPYRASRIDGLDSAATDPAIPSYLQAPAYSKPDGVSPDLAREAFIPSPAIGDLDGDGKKEIVLATWPGTIFVVNSDGTARKPFPKTLPRIPSCPLDPTAPSVGTCMDVPHRFARGVFGSPVLADMDKDGKLEIVVAAFDGNIYVFKADGTLMNGWPVAVHYNKTLAKPDEYNRVLTTPTVADFNGDGIPDVFTGSNERLGGGSGAGAAYMIDGRGMAAGNPPYLKNWPVSMTSFNLFPLISEGLTTSGAAADFDGDGRPDAIIHGNGSSPLILPGDPGTQETLGSLPTNALPERVDKDGNPKRGLEPSGSFGELSTAAMPDIMFPLFAQPSIGDLDQDGTPDLTASGGSLSLAMDLQSQSAKASRGQQLLSMWSGKNGKMLPGSPVVLEDYTFFNNHTIADLSGDDYPEVITGTGSYFVRAVDGCGREAPGFPKFTGQWIIAAVAIGDIDGDHGLEAVVNTRNGWLYAWRTKGKDSGVIAWESFHHDNYNTGSLTTKLEQGVYKKAVEPLDCKKTPPAQSDAGGTPAPEAGVAPAEQLTPGGGTCACSTPGLGSRGRWGFLAGGLAAIGAALTLGRRRRLD